MKPDLEFQLSRLPSLGTGDLRNLWLKVFEKPPHPKLRRELLIPILSYRLQEKALGGLRTATARRLQTIADELASGQKSVGNNHPGPRTGTRMVRQWQGRLHEVVTLESGFLYDGQKYRSLSEIARAITGTRWSGPAFFGFKKRSSGGAKRHFASGVQSTPESLPKRVSISRLTLFMRSAKPVRRSSDRKDTRDGH